MKKEVNKQSKKVEPFDYASFEKEAINGLYGRQGSDWRRWYIHKIDAALYKCCIGR
ncbi:MAG: hypothetical protein IPN55_01815 [Saprospiraceae bacterium]|nr:hypothetical protein [Candidatus Brachybacter algidus]